MVSYVIIYISRVKLFTEKLRPTLNHRALTNKLYYFLFLENVYATVRKISTDNLNLFLSDLIKLDLQNVPYEIFKNNFDAVKWSQNISCTLHLMYQDIFNVLLLIILLTRYIILTLSQTLFSILRLTWYPAPRHATCGCNKCWEGTRSIFSYQLSSYVYVIILITVTVFILPNALNHFKTSNFTNTE